MVEQFCWKKARLLHFVETLDCMVKNCVSNFYELALLKEIVSGSEF